MIDCDRYELSKKGFKFWYFIDIVLCLEYLKTFPFYNDFTTEDKVSSNLNKINKNEDSYCACKSAA